jgi:hypothetical protein
MVNSTASINPFNQAALARRIASQTTGNSADKFAAELSAALQQALRELGVNPAAVQVSTEAKGQDTATAADSRQFVVTVKNSGALSADPDTLPAAAAANPYRNDIGGYNPQQYATDATAQDLASTLGATVVKTSTTGASVPPQNMLDFGNGFIANAGLVEQFYEAFGATVASKMLADQANLASGSASSVVNPSLPA